MAKRVRRHLSTDASRDSLANPQSRHHRAHPQSQETLDTLRSCGVKYHRLPISARSDLVLHNPKACLIVGAIFLVDEDGELNETIMEPFADLSTAVRVAEFQVDQKEENMGAFVGVIILLTEMMCPAEKTVFLMESAVEEVIAFANSLYEQGLMPSVELWQAEREADWAAWRKAVQKWVDGDD